MKICDHCNQVLRVDEGLTERETRDMRAIVVKRTLGEEERER